jgi:hypothetical protein
VLLIVYIKTLWEFIIEVLLTLIRNGKSSVVWEGRSARMHWLELLFRWLVHSRNWYCSMIIVLILQSNWINTCIRVRVSRSRWYPTSSIWTSIKTSNNLLILRLLWLLVRLLCLLCMKAIGYQWRNCDLV